MAFSSFYCGISSRAFSYLISKLSLAVDLIVMTTSRFANLVKNNLRRLAYFGLSLGSAKTSGGT